MDSEKGNRVFARGTMCPPWFLEPKKSLVWIGLNCQKVSSSVTQVVLEMFEEVYLKGDNAHPTPSPPPGWDRVKVVGDSLNGSKRMCQTLVKTYPPPPPTGYDSVKDVRPRCRKGGAKDGASTGCLDKFNGIDRHLDQEVCYARQQTHANVYNLYVQLCRCCWKKFF